MAELQSAQAWHLRGRAAAAVGDQGWQASLDWRQAGDEADVDLAGPLGMGAVALRVTRDGVALRNASGSATPDVGVPAGAPAAAALIRERLGFEPPFGYLRYWLLGVPTPAQPADVERGADDRPIALTQADWHIAYTRYGAVKGDVLPTLLTLQHGAARVRIIVDRWEFAGAP